MQNVTPGRVLTFPFALAVLTAALWTATAATALAADADQSTAVDHPPTASRNAYYPSNRAPLHATPLVELPLGAVKPAGWLRKQLELQAAGFHGHLGDISRFLKKDGNAWLDPQGAGEHGWEEVPYWLKGYILTAYLVNDQAMIREAHTWIEGALNSLQGDGWFGPQQTNSTVSSTKGKYDLWPNMIMLFCLQSYYDQTADPRVLNLMTKYFRWELRVPEEDFLPPFWQQQRAADNLYSVYWLYNRTGDSWLLDLATKIHRHTANWTDDVANWHNVNMAQAFGGPTTYFMQSGDPRHLRAAYRNYAKIRDLYGQVPGGMFAGDENCRPGFHDPHQAIETCGMVEMMLSLETLVNITGDLIWADRCEDVTFNSLPAALTADFRALRYLTAPNMVVSDGANHSPGVQNRGAMFLMNPHAHRCCQLNYGHGWPYYAVHLWSATSDNGLAAIFYCQADVTARVGDGTQVTIHQTTHYPFDEQIKLTVHCRKPVRFPLYLRVPGWCQAPELSVNGAPLQIAARPRQFLRIEREWTEGDTIELALPMRIALRTWKQNGDSVSVDRGPLTYSLKIGEKQIRAGGTDEWPAWEIHPTTAWNYGLMVDAAEPAKSFQVIRREWPESDMPFTLPGVPIELKGQGKRIPAWKIDEHGLVGKVPSSPVRSAEPAEAITLIPMGAARLRITAFPSVEVPQYPSSSSVTLPRNIR